MVTITDYKVRQREDETKFCILRIQGGIEMVKSKSGSYYATAKKAIIASTFDELTCQNLIGTQMEGEVVKQECEAYEHTVKQTGEIITLNHKYVYQTQEEFNNQQRVYIPENIKSKKPLLEPAL